MLITAEFSQQVSIQLKNTSGTAVASCTPLVKWLNVYSQIYGCLTTTGVLYVWQVCMPLVA